MIIGIWMKRDMIVWLSQIQVNKQFGMILMDDYLLELYKHGTISKEKAIEFSVDKTGMASKLR